MKTTKKYAVKSVTSITMYNRGRKGNPLKDSIVGAIEALKQGQFIEVPREDASYASIYYWCRSIADEISFRHIKDEDGKSVCTRVIKG